MYPSPLRWFNLTTIIFSLMFILILFLLLNIKQAKTIQHVKHAVRTKYTVKTKISGRLERDCYSMPTS